MNTRERVELRGSLRGEISVKWKPDTFDGSAPLREFLAQFDLIVRANRWEMETKAAVLASCLRGKARAVLEGIKFGESIASFGSDIERLSQLAYPECSNLIRDEIACAQFVSTLSDGFVKRALQLEGSTSLRIVVVRAKAIKLIQENSFQYKKENNFNFVKKKEKNFGNSDKGEINLNNKEKEGKFNKNKFTKFEKGSIFKRGNGSRKECWECGKEGHFRSKCPGSSINKN
ncbi:hypothetical protein ALC57_15420 [Trachymyrmex cornetzi]|uniref:CCHC-type domain-containing protein n=1 Tax=Trachymyrmex cornetzi TaxID=471704 RepID=A0A151IX51_9HYME|nr:hypothetical protein ALC57_15420 [Trachymyrmex cornetzi]